MPRIRTIKPEFVQSESLSRVSRDARLLFVSLWPFVDDSGRIRGNLRYLSSTLLPYDTDAPDRIEEWIVELESIGAVRRYIDDEGLSYLDIPKWLSHQRIEKPSKSRLPSFDDCSPTIPRLLSDSSRKIVQDLGPRTLDLGPTLIPDQAPLPDRSKNQPQFVSSAIEIAKPPDPPVLMFPCNGEPSEWALTESAIREWSSLYPGVDITGECRRALAWVQANHRKTARGMPRFLVSWLNHSNDSGRGRSRSMAVASDKASRTIAAADEGLAMVRQMRGGQ